VAAATQIKPSKKAEKVGGTLKPLLSSFLNRVCLEELKISLLGGFPKAMKYVYFFHSPTLRLISRYSMIQKLKSRPLSP